MQTSLICKLFSLDSVASWSRDVNKYGGGVDDLNPFSLDAQNNYGRRAHYFKPNLNTSYFQDGR